MLQYNLPKLRKKPIFKPKPEEPPITIPEAPIVPTSNMRVSPGKGISIGKPKDHEIQLGRGPGQGTYHKGDREPIKPGLSGSPSIEEVWKDVPGGFGEGMGRNKDDLEDMGRELEDDLRNQGIGDSGTNVAPPWENEAIGEKTTDELANQAIRELLSGGVRDTSEDEALIRELLQSTVGQGQADLNARLAAGGFGTSGALGALSGDMRKQAASKAAQDIMGVRGSARDEWLERTMAGIQAEFKDRGMDLSEEQFDQYMKMLEELADSDTGAETEDKTDIIGDVAGSIVDGIGNRAGWKDKEKELGDKMTEDWIKSIQSSPGYLYILMTQGQKAADAWMMQQFGVE